MKAGIFLPQSGDSATRDNVLYIAKEAEREGFNSVWVMERLLGPINPQSPYPGIPDGSLPVEYQNVLDPLESNTRHPVAGKGYCRSRNWMVKR